MCIHQEKLSNSFLLTLPVSAYSASRLISDLHTTSPRGKAIDDADFRNLDPESVPFTPRPRTSEYHDHPAFQLHSIVLPEPDPERTPEEIVTTLRESPIED